METQERETRARRELEERLAQARRDSRKFQTELQQAQKEAESYKDRLQTIKEKDTEDGPHVGNLSSGEQFARQLFIQPGSLEVVMCNLDRSLLAGLSDNMLSFIKRKFYSIPKINSLFEISANSASC